MWQCNSPVSFYFLFILRTCILTAAFPLTAFSFTQVPPAACPSSRGLKHHMTYRLKYPLLTSYNPLLGNIADSEGPQQIIITVWLRLPRVCLLSPLESKHTAIRGAVPDISHSQLDWAWWCLTINSRSSHTKHKPPLNQIKWNRLMIQLCWHLGILHPDRAGKWLLNTCTVEPL